MSVNDIQAIGILFSLYDHNIGVPTISKKGSMSERQVQMIINSLVKKGLIKKEPRMNNKSKTSNLYTLLSVKTNQSDKDKKGGVVNDVHHPW